MQKRGGIYIHIPFCKNKCDYCNFVSFTDFSKQRDYIEKLKSEIRSRQDASMIFDTIYIGGGTPSVLYSGAINEIKDCLFETFSFADDYEFTIEANPESCDAEFLQEFKRANANRLSLGLQSCDDVILKSVGRLHSYQQFLDALSLARSFDIGNISADLIIGLEGESEGTFKNSLKKLADLSLEHISIYSLKCEKGTKLYERGFVPNDDFLADLYEASFLELARHGYNRYEVSNFERGGFKSRHNMKYWQLEPYLGFGVAAHSYYKESDEPRVLKRRANTSSLMEYLRGEILESEQDVSTDEREEFLMLGLRLAKGISLEEYKERFKEDLLKTHGEQIARLTSSGHLLKSDSHIRIAPSSVYIMNSILLSLI